MKFETTATINDVHNFWNNSFLYSQELTEEPGTKEFYEAINTLKLNDVEKFSYNFWEFDKHQGEKVLDIGCGPGWLVRQFAENNADIYAVDIAEVAVGLTNKMLELYDLKAKVQKGNAESLPFEDNYFDFISSSGVLHHSPNMQKAVDEVFRVLKPGKEARITIYYKNLILNESLFPLFLIIYCLFKPKAPGKEGLKKAKNVNDFIRMYDGDYNPVGYGLTTKECYNVFSKFNIIGHEIHFFPKRFFPLLKHMPEFLYRKCDKYLGTMIYLKLRKPV